MGTQFIEIKGEIEEIKSLIVNWGSNCINSRSMIKIKKGVEI
jgi:hypothetical protein